MEIQSEALKNTSEDGFIKKLLERRIPQILLFYIGSVWTLFGIVSWVVNRYVLSPHLEELFLMTGLLFLPAVLIIAYGHGAKGNQPWKRYEKIGLTCNVLLAGALLFFMFRGKDLGSAQKVVQVVDTEGNAVERLVPKDAFRKRVALFYFENESGNEDLDWLQSAIPHAWDADLDQDLFLTVQPASAFVDRFQKAGFEDGLNIPTALKRNITSDYNLAYFINGSFTQEGDEYIINTELYGVERGKELASQEYRGSDIFALIDEMTVDIKKDLDLPSKHIEDTIDLPVSDVLTSSEPALKAYSDGIFAIGFKRDFATGLADLTTATSEDPTFALAFVSKYVLELQQGQMQPAMQSLAMAEQHNYRLTEQMKYLIKVAQLNLTGNHDQALEAATQWSTLFPNDLMAHQISGMLHSLRNNYDEAIDSYRNLLRIDPFQDQISLTVGNLLRQSGRVDESVEHFEEYITLHPDKSDGYQMLAEVYQSEGELDKELETREKALSISPNDPAAILNLGDVLQRMGKFDEALSRYETAVSQSKTPQEQITSLHSLGNFHWFRGHHQKAITSYDEVLQLSETNLPILVQIYHKATLSSRYYLAGYQDKAQGFVQEALSNPGSKQFPDLAAVVAEAASYLDVRENDGEEGLKLLDEAEALVNAAAMNVMKPTLLYARGDVYMQREEYTQAKEIYEAFLELQPTAVGGLNKMGEILYEMEDYKEAKDQFENALKYSPSNPSAHLGLAKVAIARGNSDTAKTHLDQALLAWSNADDTSKKASEASELLATL